MTKSNEELYTERLDGFTRDFVNELYESGLIPFSDVVEFLEERNQYDADLAVDVHNAVDAVLNDMLDAWLSDN